MKTAIIYGVTGQDGSHLADLLLEKEYKVYGVSRRVSTDNTIRIKHLENNDRFKLLEGDITDYSSVLNTLNYHSLRQTDLLYLYPFVLNLIKAFRIILAIAPRLSV